jgi:hypothetical protein
VSIGAAAPCRRPQGACSERSRASQTG